EPLCDLLGVRGEMRGDRVGRARYVEVVAEHDLGWNRQRQLNVAAGRAPRELERIARLVLSHLVRFDEGVRERLLAEVEHVLERVRSADPAGRPIRGGLPSRTGSLD